MKIRFDSRKEHNPTQEQGLEVLYAPGKRMAFRLRWYLILFLVLSPLFWFVFKVGYGFWLVEAPAQLRLPTLDVRARDAGVVAELDVKLGDQVAAGQRLLRLDNPEWRSRMAQLQASAQLSPAPAMPVEARQQALLRAQLSRAEQRLAQARALLAEGAATRGELQAAQNERDARESELLAFEQRQLEAQQQPPAYARELIQQNAELVWLQSRLHGLQLQAGDAGRVAEILVSEGENVGPGTLLMRLTGSGEPLLWLYLEPRHIAYAEPGQPFELRLPDGRWVAGKVLQAADSARSLPGDLRSPFSANQLGLLVPGRLDEPLAAHWRVDQLPLKVRFPHDWQRLLGN